MFKRRTPYGGELEIIMNTPDTPIDQSDADIHERRLEAKRLYEARSDYDPSVRVKRRPKQNKTFLMRLKEEWQAAIEEATQQK